MTAEFVSGNYEQFFRPPPLRLLKGREWGKPRSQVTPSLAEVVEPLDKMLGKLR
jgi:hypothetical protein